MQDLRGSFLIAHPNMPDEYFSQAVLLVTSWDIYGAIAVVLNKPLPSEHNPPGITFPIFEGGPLTHDKVMVLHGVESWFKAEKKPYPPGAFQAPKSPVAPGIFLGDGFDLVRIDESKEDDSVPHRVVRGYARWGPGQLEDEIRMSGVWHLVPARGELLWGVPVSKLWGTLRPKPVASFSEN